MVACGRSLVYIGLNIIVNSARQSSMTRQALGEEAARLGRAALMLNLPQLRTYVIPKCMLEGETNHVAIAIIVARGGRLCSFVFFSSRWWDTLTPKHPSKACVSKPWSLGGAVEQICRMYLWEELCFGNRSWEGIVRLTYLPLLVFVLWLGC